MSLTDDLRRQLALAEAEDFYDEQYGTHGDPPRGYLAMAAERFEHHLAEARDMGFDDCTDNLPAPPDYSRDCAESEAVDRELDRARGLL